ncbi:hypothetical protein [Chitinimonas sp. BJB300]|uniref:hypothetical protein n=1 Tax=Chitinimonas sp. BJB300 TaxID=1559339 RepID=UPI0013043EB2|nr:hypothetical protein [Chitinimonas sp. BJB300]
MLAIKRWMLIGISSSARHLAPFGSTSNEYIVAHAEKGSGFGAILPRLIRKR